MTKMEKLSRIESGADTDIVCPYVALLPLAMPKFDTLVKPSHDGLVSITEAHSGALAKTSRKMTVASFGIGASCSLEVYHVFAFQI